MVLHHNCGSSRFSSLEKGRTGLAGFSVECREDFCRASSGSLSSVFLLYAMRGSLSSVFLLYAMRKGRDSRFCVLTDEALTQLSNQSTRFIFQQDIHCMELQRD